MFILYWHVLPDQEHNEEIPLSSSIIPLNDHLNGNQDKVMSQNHQPIGRLRVRNVSDSWPIIVVNQNQTIQMTNLSTTKLILQVTLHKNKFRK